jgi:hypothetical protein
MLRMVDRTRFSISIGPRCNDIPLASLDKQGFEFGLFGLPCAFRFEFIVGVSGEVNFGWFGAASGGVQEGELGGDLNAAACVEAALHNLGAFRRPRGVYWVNKVLGSAGKWLRIR